MFVFHCKGFSGAMGSQRPYGDILSNFGPTSFDKTSLSQAPENEGLAWAAMGNVLSDAQTSWVHGR